MDQLRQVHRKNVASNTQDSKPSWTEPLLNILLTRRGASVSDPRDMIYGHLGLLDHPPDPPIKIDYGRSVTDVYEDIARSYMMRDGTPAFLRYIEDSELEDRRDGLPSWVPDWTVPAKKIPSANLFSREAGSPPRCLFPVPHTLAVSLDDYGHVMYIIKSPTTFMKSPVQSGDGGPTTSFPQYFEEWLWFGTLDPGGKFVKRPAEYTVKEHIKLELPSNGRKPSTNNALKERITAFELTDPPETIYDAFKAICAKLYDEIAQKPLNSCPDLPSSLDEKLSKVLSYIKERFFISDETIYMAARFKLVLRRMAFLLHSMESIYFTTRDIPEDFLFAILDTGGCVHVPRNVRVNDGACGIIGSLIFYRPTPPTEAMEMAQRLQKDPNFVIAFQPMRSIQCGRYVGNGCFVDMQQSTRVDEGRMASLTAVKSPKRVLLALH